jgi:hypothetical protein
MFIAQAIKRNQLRSEERNCTSLVNLSLNSAPPNGAKQVSCSSAYKHVIPSGMNVVTSVLLTFLNSNPVDTKVHQRESVVFQAKTSRMHASNSH